LLDASTIDASSELIIWNWGTGMAAQGVKKARTEVEQVMVSPDAGLHGTPALLAMFGIMTVVLLAALDQTIVGTALPRVVAELGGFDLYGWVGTAYLLTSTVMVPIMGKLGDLYGSSVVIFVGASALGGAAPTMMWLVVARGIQGIGAGMLQATAFTSVSDMFPQPARRARWQGLITSTFAIADDGDAGLALGLLHQPARGYRCLCTGAILLACRPFAPRRQSAHRLGRRGHNYHCYQCAAARGGMGRHRPGVDFAYHY
jgi:hypothetical protein